MQELELTMSDGFQIYVSIQLPENTVKGHIHLLHGMAEHSGRYTEATKRLLKRGYIVSAHDHRGHGKTVQLNGKRGHFGDQFGFERVVEDVYEVLTYVKNQHPTNQVILLGHSMGSFVARRFIQRYGNQIDQVILSGTGDDNGIARHAGMLLAQKMGEKDGFDQQNQMLDKLVFGSFNKGINQPATKFDWLSKNPTHVYSYMMDEYCGFVPTTQFFLDLFEGLGTIHNDDEIARIPTNLPILLFSGDEDPVGNFSKAVWRVAKQYDKMGLTNVTVQLFEGGRHELFNDATRPQVIEIVLDWIDRTCPKR